MKTIGDLAASKLHRQEEQLVRHAVDELLFCEDLTSDATAEEALAGVYELVDNLVESDRLAPETAERLIADVEACGPLAAV